MKKLSLIIFSLFTFTISAQESVLDSIALTEVTVTSQVVDVARDRITPIAFSSVSGAEIDLKAGNLEFVETLKRTPGVYTCLLYTSPSPRDRTRSRMPSSA